MRLVALKNMISLAPSAGPIGRLVRATLGGKALTTGRGPKEEVDAAALDAVAGKLEQTMKKAGYKFTHTRGAKHGSWVKVHLDGVLIEGVPHDDVLVAQAFSHSHEDAVLQACLGAVKEEYAARQQASRRGHGRRT